MGIASLSIPGDYSEDLEDELEHKANGGFVLQNLEDRGFLVREEEVPDRENRDEDQATFEEKYLIRSPRGSWAHMTVRYNDRRFYGNRLESVEIDELTYRF